MHNFAPSFSALLHKYCEKVTFEPVSYTHLDAAIEAADIVLMDDDPLKISKAIKIARKCIHIVYENIYFAIGIKILCLILLSLIHISVPIVLTLA